MLHIPVQYRPKTRAGFANVNSSAGWVWAGSSKKTDSSLAIADIEQRAERSRSLRNWPLRNDMSPRSGNQDNIV